MFIIICPGSQYPPLLRERCSFFSGCDSSNEKHRRRRSFVLPCAFCFCPGITRKEALVSPERAAHGDGGGRTALSQHLTTVLSRFVRRARMIISKGLFFHSSRDFQALVARVQCLPTTLSPFTDTHILGQVPFLLPCHSGETPLD